ncbi:MAG: hypothetical protein ABI703_11025 [Gemmatimonadales bacterium]
MSTGQGHDEVQELLAAAALEILDGAEQQQVLTHVSACSECPRLLDQYRKVVATIALQLPGRPVHPDRAAALRARLLGRVQAHRMAPARRRSWIERQGGWMVAAALAGLLLVHHSVHRPLAYGWLAAGVLILALVALGAYVRVIRARLSALQHFHPDTERMPPGS